jgi:hypothetical protein
MLPLADWRAWPIHSATSGGMLASPSTTGWPSARLGYDCDRLAMLASSAATSCTTSFLAAGRDAASPSVAPP